LILEFFGLRRMSLTFPCLADRLENNKRDSSEGAERNKGRPNHDRRPDANEIKKRCIRPYAEQRSCGPFKKPIHGLQSPLWPRPSLPGARPGRKWLNGYFLVEESASDIAIAVPAAAPAATSGPPIAAPTAAAAAVAINESVIVDIVISVLVSASVASVTACTRPGSKRLGGY
jgi:hypothetical protein